MLVSPPSDCGDQRCNFAERQSGVYIVVDASTDNKFRTGMRSCATYFSQNCAGAGCHVMCKQTLCQFALRYLGLGLRDVGWLQLNKRMERPRVRPYGTVPVSGPCARAAQAVVRN